MGEYGDKPGLRRALAHPDLLWLLTGLLAKAQHSGSEEQTGVQSCQKVTLVTQRWLLTQEKSLKWRGEETIHLLGKILTSLIWLRGQKENTAPSLIQTNAISLVRNTCGSVGLCSK